MTKQVCSGGFLMKKNRFLFGKRSMKKTWAPGVWDIPGGKALKNEHPLYTLKRELYEETKIIVMNAELLTSIDVFENSTQDYFIYHIYMVTHWKGKPVNNSKEHTKLRWFSREDLNETLLAVPQYPAMIDEWLQVQSNANKS